MVIIKFILNDAKYLAQCQEQNGLTINVVVDDDTTIIIRETLIKGN